MDGLYEQFRIALHSVWKRRWLALAVAWGLCLAGWLAVALIPNSYESKAKVFAEMQSILPDRIGVTAAERQQDLLRVKQMLMSSENLEKVVRRTDLNLLVASDRDLAAQVSSVREAVKITAQQDNLFEISATLSAPGLTNAQNARAAAAVVQNLLDLFVEENLSGARAETGRTLGILDSELKRLEGQLQEAERQRVEFEQQFLGLLPGEGSISQRQSAARAELSNIEQQLVVAQGAVNAMRGQLASTPATLPVPGAVGGVGGFAGQLAALEGQLAQAHGKGWTDSHPDVITLRSQIERLRPMAEREARSGGGGTSTPNPAHASLRTLLGEREAQLSALTMRKNQLQQGMGMLAQKQSSEPGVMSEQARLSRDYEVLKRQYDQLLENREQVRLRGDVQTKSDAVNFQIIEPPTQPKVPVAPNRPLLLTLILFAAIAAGIGVAFAKGQIQTTFPTHKKLEQVTGLPVLGSVSQVFSAEARAERKQRLKWFAGASGALAGGYALLMIVEFWQRSMVA